MNILIPSSLREECASLLRDSVMVSSVELSNNPNEIIVTLKDSFENITPATLFKELNNSNVDLGNKILKKALDEKDRAVQEEFLKLISEWDELDYNKYYIKFSNLMSTESLKILLDTGLKPQVALDGILRVDDVKPDDIDLQVSLIEASILKGATAKELTYIQSDISIKVINLLLDDGMSGGLIVARAFEEKDSVSRKELLQKAIDHGALSRDFHMVLTPYCDQDILEFLLAKNISAQSLLHLVIKGYEFSSNEETNIQNLKLISFLENSGANFQKHTKFGDKFIKDNINLILERKCNLDKILSNYNKYTIYTERNDEFDLVVQLIKHGANPNSANIQYFTVSQIKQILELGLDPKKLGDVIFSKANPQYKDRKYVETLLNDELEELINLAIERNANFTDSFEKLLKHPSYVQNSDGSPVCLQPSNEILKHLNKKNLLSADVLLKTAVKEDNLEFMKYSLDIGGKINSNKGKTLLDYAIRSENLECAKYIVNELGETDFNHIEYIGLISRSFGVDTQNICNLLGRFFDSNKLIELAPQQGLSPNHIDRVLDYHNILLSYVNEDGNLSALERSILDLDPDITAEALQNIELQNKWGYSPLHLAIITYNHKLAAELVMNGADLFQKTKANNTILDLLLTFHPSGELIEAILSKCSNIDLINEDGNSLVDIIRGYDTTQKKVIELSNDPLFVLHKEDINPSDVLQDGKTHIGLLYDQKTSIEMGLFAISRLIRRDDPNMLVHLVSPEMINKFGDDFLKSFNGFIAPGFGVHTDPLEKLHQKTIDHCEQTKTPFFGICGGTLYLGDHKKTGLVKVDGYKNGGQNIHDIIPTKSSLFSYMLSSDENQKNIENKKGVCTEIKPFKANTQHSKAINNTNLGKEELGALSEDGVTMAYNTSLDSGLVLGVQFHPEAAFFSNTEDAIPQKNLIKSFFKLAKMHKEGTNIASFLQDVVHNMSEMDVMLEEHNIDIAGGSDDNSGSDFG